MTARDVLVVAGEASGDRIAAAVATELGRAGRRCWGLAGEAGRAAGIATVADLRDVTAMGAGPVFARLGAVLSTFAKLSREARRRGTRDAVLVDFPEFNARLARGIRARGGRVTWCVAPQVWAWRASRLRTFGARVDRLAVVLPFEEALWRAAGADARYVGHPALEAPLPGRAAARAHAGIAPAAVALALLPGSRAHEVRTMLPVQLAAAARLAATGVTAAVLLAASLDGATRAFATNRARAAGVPVLAVDASSGAAPLLPAFDAAVATTGTVTLECALAGVPLVSTYRASRLAAAVARRWLRTPHLALPNVLLGARRVPELVQEEATPARLAAALDALLAAGPARARETEAELRSLMSRGLEPGTLGARVAGWVDAPVQGASCSVVPA